MHASPCGGYLVFVCARYVVGELICIPVMHDCNLSTRNPRPPLTAVSDERDVLYSAKKGHSLLEYFILEKDALLGSVSSRGRCTNKK